MRLKEIKPGMVIHCKTEEEKMALKTELENRCYHWTGGFNIGDVSIWGGELDLLIFVKEDNNVQWARPSEEQKENVKITKFSDLIIPELSAKEVLEIVGEICCENSDCSECPLNTGNGYFCNNPKLFSENADEIIDICTKWREEHPKEEKKEIETEWVYVVRIIKVHDNGKKECVHEVDYGEYEQKEYGFLDVFANGQLAKYCSEHKGNFFAVYERVCRIKE